jgi:hypothetical protein
MGTEEGARGSKQTAALHISLSERAAAPSGASWVTLFHI